MAFLFGPLGVIVEVCMPTGQEREIRQKEIAEAATAAALAREKRAAAVNERSEEAHRRREERWQRAVIRAQAKANRRAERVKRYRATGIEPGRWARYRALSDVQQAVVLGLAFGLLAGVILIGISLVPKLFGAR
jgi:hypothetical protein